MTHNVNPRRVNRHDGVQGTLEPESVDLLSGDQLQMLKGRIKRAEAVAVKWKNNHDDKYGTTLSHEQTFTTTRGGGVVAAFYVVYMNHLATGKHSLYLWDFQIQRWFSNEKYMGKFTKERGHFAKVNEAEWGSGAAVAKLMHSGNLQWELPAAELAMLVAHPSVRRSEVQPTRLDKYIGTGSYVKYAQNVIDGVDK